MYTPAIGRHFNIQPAASGSSLMGALWTAGIPDLETLTIAANPARPELWTAGIPDLDTLVDCSE